MLSEILYKICEFDMKNIMSFMLLSKRVHKYFSTREHVIIRKTLYTLEKRIYDTKNLRNYQKDNTDLEKHITSLQLDKWMVAPFQLVSSELVSKILKIVKERKYDQLMKGEYFIAGGAISQIALDMFWESDVDIFIPCQNKDEEKRENKIINNHNCDIITKFVSRPEKVLRRFDISLCQIGVLVTPNSLTVYTTPLFLCSLFHKIMPVQVADITCDYLYHPNNKQRVENYFKKHILFHDACNHEDDFMNCVTCRLIAMNNVVNQNCRLSRWFKRVQKYKDRFPEFKISYYFARK